MQMGRPQKLIKGLLKLLDIKQNGFFMNLKLKCIIVLCIKALQIRCTEVRGSVHGALVGLLCIG